MLAGLVSASRWRLLLDPAEGMRTCPHVVGGMEGWIGEGWKGGWGGQMGEDWEGG